VPHFLNPWALDSFVWVDHARAMARKGEWRLERTELDNAPYGRPVRWHSGLALGLVGLGRLWTAAEPGEPSFGADPGEQALGAEKGEPNLGARRRILDRGIERAAVWIGPLLFFGWTLALTGIVARRLGWLAAGAIFVCLIASGDVYGHFHPGEPDHHGLAATCAAGTLLGLLLDRDRRARSGWILSAVCGAMGLWINAATQSVVLAGLGGAALLIVCLPARFGVVPASAGGGADPRHDSVGIESGLPDPVSWRLWGWTGAGVSLAFWAFESVPHAISWQLEVNHPLYALAWAAGGELLATVTAARARAGSARGPAPGAFVHGADGRARGVKGSDRFRIAAAAVVALAPLVVSLGSGGRTHVFGDPFLMALHAKIAEFQPVTTAFAGGGLSLLQAFGALPLILVGALLLLRGARVPEERWHLWVCVVALGLATIARLLQVRWGAVWGGFAVAASVVVVPLAWRELRRRMRAIAVASIAAALVVTALAISPVQAWRTDRARARMGDELTIEELRALVLRDVAFTIAGDSPSARVLSGPSASVPLGYFGGFGTIGTLYWENADGLRDAATIATASDDAVAKQELARRGVTYIVLTDWEDFARGYLEVLRPAEAGSASTFGRRIRRPEGRSPWLAEVPYPTLPQAQELGLGVQLLSVSR
jgi:hypothetical protein